MMIPDAAEGARAPTSKSPREKGGRHKAALLRHLRDAPFATWPQALLQCLQKLPALGICRMAELTPLLRAAVEHTELHPVQDAPESMNAPANVNTSTGAEPAEQGHNGSARGGDEAASRPQDAPVLSPSVRRIRRFIREHYSEDISLDRLAASVGRNTQYIATLFHQQTGITIHRYLITVRLRQAAKMLRRQDKVEAVMLMVGYRGKKNFYRQFQSIFGTTPGRYKAAHSPRRHRTNGRFEAPRDA